MCHPLVANNTFGTFIDDQSMKVWVYFLKYKLELFVAFKMWKAMVENQIGLKIKRLRTNNGGEYLDTRFKKFCFEDESRLERTVPGTPQHNGVAEHMNQKLTEEPEAYMQSLACQNNFGQKLSTRQLS